RKLDLKVVIQYNNRKLLTGMLEVFGTEREKVNKVVLILDKLEKVGLESVVTELNEQNLSKSTISLLRQFLSDENNSGISYFESFSTQNEQVKESLDELRQVTSYIQ